jgi:hypothetical protein
MFKLYLGFLHVCKDLVMIYIFCLSVLFAQSAKPESEWDQNTQKMILCNVDNTTKLEGEFKKMNTLGHYQVKVYTMFFLINNFFVK